MFQISVILKENGLCDTVDLLVEMPTLTSPKFQGK